VCVAESAQSTGDFEVLSALLMKLQVFSFTSCLLVNTDDSKDCLPTNFRLLDPEDEGTTIFRNVGNYLTVGTA
jgi:hypothetical protein